MLNVVNRKTYKLNKHNNNEQSYQEPKPMVVKKTGATKFNKESLIDAINPLWQKINVNNTNNINKPHLNLCCYVVLAYILINVLSMKLQSGRQHGQ